MGRNKSDVFNFVSSIAGSLNSPKKKQIKKKKKKLANRDTIGPGGINIHNIN